MEDKEPIAWESTTPYFFKYITDSYYNKLGEGYKKWYKPYMCSSCECNQELKQQDIY